MNKNDKFHGMTPEMNPATELNDDILDSVAGGSGGGNGFAYSVGTRVIFKLPCLGHCMGSGGTILSRHTNGDTNFNAHMNIYRVKCEYCGYEGDYTEAAIRT